MRDQGSKQKGPAEAQIKRSSGALTSRQTLAWAISVSTQSQYHYYRLYRVNIVKISNINTSEGEK